jgi:hypothetical protein
MPDLIAFLLARIDDEEQLARDAASEGIPHRTGWQLWTSKIDTTPGGEPLGPRGSVEASPARVLAECETKRRIVDLWYSAKREASMGAEWPVKQFFDGRQSIIEAALRALALPYADHADYQPEWRP